MSNLWVAIVVSVVGAALGILLLGGRLRDPKWGPILAGGLAIALLAAGIVRAGSDSARFPYLVGAVVVVSVAVAVRTIRALRQT